MQNMLNRLQEEIQGVFKQNLGIVPANVISNLTDQTKELLKKEIEASRVSERNENITNRLGPSVKASSVQEMARGVQECIDAGVYVNKSFEEKADEVLSRVVRAYRTVLEQHPSKRSDMALDEIRGRCKRTFNGIQEYHDDYSQKIKKGVFRQLEETGIILSDAERQKVEQQVDKEASLFAQQLSSEVRGKAEVARDDAQQLSGNEAAFRGASEPITTTREDLETLFK